MAHLQDIEILPRHSLIPTHHMIHFLWNEVLWILHDSKGEKKCTRILQKKYINIFRRRGKLTHSSGIIHLEYRAYPKLCTQKNGVINAAMTQ